MTPLENYAQLVESHFGGGTSTLDVGSAVKNEVIDALAYTDENFATFRLNFEARLQRLSEAYRGHPSLPALLEQVNLVGSPNNWQGAAAELAAFDFFLSRRNFLGRPPALNVSIDSSRALAGRYGARQANLDVHFVRFNTFTDVKVLQDNVSEILQGIYHEVWGAVPPKIHAQYPMDSGYHSIQAQRTAVVPKPVG